MYIVKFECDLLGNHTAPITNLCEIDEIKFNDALTALIFIEECTSPLTREVEICPWIANNPNVFTENRPICVPFSEVKSEFANIHLIMNEDDFKTLI
tara:strand:- start:24 stop:314 length:291 start_codon:yes stop_codon:yes gene_type:complete